METDDDPETLEALAAERAFLRELSLLGVDVARVCDLVFVESSKRLTVARFLTEKLPSIRNDRLRVAVVRQLAVPWARGISGPTLLSEFRNTKCRMDRWAVGNALGVVADPSMIVELLELSTNREFGTARQMIVYNLWRFRAPHVLDTLIELTDDRAVRLHALHALGRIGGEAAEFELSYWSRQGSDTVKKECQNALKRLAKRKDAAKSRNSKPAQREEKAKRRIALREPIAENDLLEDHLPGGKPPGRRRR